MVLCLVWTSMHACTANNMATPIALSLPSPRDLEYRRQNVPGQARAHFLDMICMLWVPTFTYFACIIGKGGRASAKMHSCQYISSLGVTMPDPSSCSLHNRANNTYMGEHTRGMYGLLSVGSYLAHLPSILKQT